MTMKISKPDSTAQCLLLTCKRTVKIMFLCHDVVDQLQNSELNNADFDYEDRGRADDLVENLKANNF